MTTGSSSGSSRRRGPPREAGRRSRPPCSCVGCSLSRHGRNSSTDSCSSSGWLKRAPASPDWPAHLQAAVDAAPDRAAGADAAIALALALSRAQRFADAVEVLDRASSLLDGQHSELAVLLETAAVGAGMNGAVTAPTVAARREAVHGRAMSDPDAPPELLAVAAFISVLTNEPASVGAELAVRALLAGAAARERTDERPWYSFATWFSQATISLIWAERYAQVRPLLDTSIAEARATGDSSRLAVGLAHRGWLALRRGDLSAAEADTRTALAAAELPAPTLYRVLNGGVLLKSLVDQGLLDEAEQALAPLEAEAESGSLTAAVLRLSRGRLRVERGLVADGLDDFLAVGSLTARALVTCPSYIPWRSEAALAQLALGDEDAARVLAEEELELARAFGAPRALGVALHASGVVVGGDRGELLLREAVTRSPKVMQGSSEPVRSPTSARSSVAATGGARRASYFAKGSTSHTVPARARSPSARRPSCARPARGRAESSSAVSSR